MPLCKSTPTLKLLLPPSPLHLDSFIREPLRELLTDEQCFPLAYTHDNPTSLSAFSKVTCLEPIVRETTFVEAPSWTRYDYEHSPSEAFKALTSDVIVHLSSPTWTCPVQAPVVKMPPQWLAPSTQQLV